MKYNDTRDGIADKVFEYFCRLPISEDTMVRPLAVQLRITVNQLKAALGAQELQTHNDDSDFSYGMKQYVQLLFRTKDLTDPVVQRCREIWRSVLVIKSFESFVRGYFLGKHGFALAVEIPLSYQAMVASVCTSGGENVAYYRDPAMALLAQFYFYLNCLDESETLAISGQSDLERRFIRWYEERFKRLFFSIEQGIVDDALESIEGTDEFSLARVKEIFDEGISDGEARAKLKAIRQNSSWVSNMKGIFACMNIDPESLF